MADSRRYGLRNQIDIRDILLEAQHRWLRPAEICQILENYKKFEIAPEPATMPPSGSLFLFDRKVLRYFRKDGHNWRKKKDGKTVKEAHERLKSGSVDVLHCYYAHGQENENFQRRSYWMLEEELSHIVLVHYLDVKGNRTYLHRNRETEESAPSPLTEATSSYDTNSASRYNIHQGKNQVPSQTTDTSSNSCPTSEFEDAESSYSNQAISSVQSAVHFEQAGSQNVVPVAFSNGYQENLPVTPGMNFLSLTPAEINKDSSSAGLTFEHPPQLDLSSWEEVYGNLTHVTGTVHKQDQDILGELYADGIDKKQDLGSQSQVKEEWQWLGNQKLQPDLVYEVTSGFEGQEVSHDDSVASDRQFSKQTVDRTSVGNISARIEENNSYPSPLKHAFSDVLAEESFKKMDSFNRWMSKELDVSEIHMESSTGAGSYWDPVEGENAVNSNNSEEHEFTLSPSLSQDQLYSITDFVPNWGYSGLEVKVLVTGKFLKTPEEVAKHKWSCMFGEVEVPAEIIADGVLRCHAPLHKVGRVPFYVTCSNRLACSEVREFEYSANQFQEENTANSNNGSSITELLKMRFANLLCLSSVSRSTSDLGDLVQKSQLSSKISSLLNDDNGEWDEMLRFTSEGSLDATREQIMQKLLKENLYAWLLDKAVEGGKGASVLDEEGQGVLHFAAALGYDWALQPTITAGVSVNFRDLKGWTALHWAAYCGKERTVGLLISLGADPGALTDPTPKYPRGRTATDLASSNGHKGIAGFLAESALSSHLSSLNLDQKETDAATSPGGKAVQTISERFPTRANGELPSGLSMKDSLAAVCNATQAAARIHQVFRLQSFQRKVLKEYDDDKFGISDERALLRVAVKQKKSGHDPAQAAAIRIQNKFRGWKGRKEFLIIRQQIVKIQAHVRGHQVRNKHKKITWSVGILEKVILRWRRKGSGLRGFKSEALTETSNMMNENTSSNVEEDFDFLKEGRKQTEERMQKYLARVKSMVQYPEARDQYRRLLNVVSEIQEAKGIEEMVSVSYEETTDYDDNIDIDALLDEADRYMPMLP